MNRNSTSPSPSSRSLPTFIPPATRPLYPFLSRSLHHALVPSLPLLGFLFDLWMKSPSVSGTVLLNALVLPLLLLGRVNAAIPDVLVPPTEKPRIPCLSEGNELTINTLFSEGESSLPLLHSKGEEEGIEFEHRADFLPFPLLPFFSPLDLSFHSLARRWSINTSSTMSLSDPPSYRTHLLHREGSGAQHRRIPSGRDSS